ncbi:FAD:protein FMN transferase [Lachnospiraceae bacterium ZAX-1]
MKKCSHISPIGTYLLGFILLTVFVASIGLTQACSNKRPEPIAKYGFYFDTVIAITLYDATKETLIDDCFTLAEKYEKLFSRTMNGSDVYNINHAGGQPVFVDLETIALIEQGLKYGKVSNGAFDITIGAVSDLWDFKSDSHALPSPSDIAQAVSTVSYHTIIIGQDTITLSNPNTQLDLGGIAKGFIADKMKEYLLSNGITQGFINLGGNVLALGQRSDGQNYTFGIQKPFAKEGTSIATVEITDQTVVTSGVYERYFEQNGIRYHHILDPKTGYPYENNLLGVTIICPNSIDGDGLSTTCFALGLEKGMELIESHKDTEAIFITDDFKLHITSGLGSTIPFKEISL